MAMMAVVVCLAVLAESPKPGISVVAVAMAEVVAAAAACSVEAIQIKVHACRWKAGGAQGGERHHNLKMPDLFGVFEQRQQRRWRWLV